MSDVLMQSQAETKVLEYKLNRIREKLESRVNIVDPVTKVELQVILAMIEEYEIDAEKRAIYSDINEINAVALMLRDGGTITEAAAMLEASAVREAAAAALVEPSAAAAASTSRRVPPQISGVQEAESAPFQRPWEVEVV